MSIQSGNSGTQSISESEMTECQFNTHCGGWCETVQQLEHNLCEHCLEAHDDELALHAVQLPAGPIDCDWEEVRQNSDRYLWLRGHAVRIQGSQLWYQGAALDIRVDVGLEHMAMQAKPVPEGGEPLLGLPPE